MVIPCSSFIPGLPPRTGSIAYINIIMPSVFGTICLLGVLGTQVVFAVVKRSMAALVPAVSTTSSSSTSVQWTSSPSWACLHESTSSALCRSGTLGRMAVPHHDHGRQQSVHQHLLLTACSLALAATCAVTPSPPWCQALCPATLVICLLWALSYASSITPCDSCQADPLPGGTVGCGIRLPNRALTSAGSPAASFSCVCPAPP